MRETDPILLGRIRRRFLLLRNGTLLAYDAESLRDFIVSSGDYRDPISRQTLAKHELLRLGRVTGSPLPCITDLSERHHREIARRQLLTHFHSELGLTNDIGIMVQIVDNLRRVAEPHELANVLGLQYL